MTAIELRPFVTLDALAEHLGAIRSAFRVERVEGFDPPPGSPAYHVNAAEDCAASLLQQLIVLMPDDYERTEGDDDLIERIRRLTPSRKDAARDYLDFLASTNE